MMRSWLGFVAFVLGSSGGLAAAQQTIVVLAAEGAPVSLGEVEAVLRRQLPGVQVSTDGDDAVGGGAARVVIASWADGRLAVSYRSASGRETVRLVEPGAEPAATIAMVVVNLQADQLDAVLGPAQSAPPVRATAAALPAPPAARATRRLRTTVRPATPDSPAARLEVGAGLAGRNLALDVEGSTTQRSYASGAYAIVTLGASLFPARLFDERGALSWFGLGVAAKRSALLTSTGIDGVTGTEVDVGATHTELAATVRFEVPLSSAPEPPRLKLAAGWSRVAFAFDVTQMVRVDPSEQMPSFAYEGYVLDAAVEVPVADTGVTAGVGFGLHEVTDVGQEVRDLFGADTDGAFGWGAHAALRGTLVPRLEWTAAFSIRQFDTVLQGPSSADGGRLGAFPNASDRFVEGQLAVAYRTP